MSRWHKALLAGLIAGVACLAAVGWSSARQISFQRHGIEDETRLMARQVAVTLRNGLEKHLIALEQMATFFENSEEVTEEEFQSFATATLKRTPLCLRISAVDPSLRVRWVHPLETNRAVIGFEVKSNTLGYETTLRAMTEKEAVLSPPLELVGGAPGFILAAPIFRRASFTGLVVCSLRNQDFFASLLLPEVLERYEESVEDAGAPIFATASFEGTDAPIEPQVNEFDLGGRTWTIRVHSKGELVRKQLASGQLAFWIVGCLLALGVSSAAGLGTFWASEIMLRLRTQRKALRETRERLDGAMEQLLQAEKMTALGELVAGVAHEINNPLSSILGYTQLLMGKDLPEEVKTRRLETVHSEAERMARIVKNLLTFARKHPPEKRYLGLNGIIEKTLELKSYHFRVNQIRIVKELDPNLPKTMLDFHQLQQVFLNLFTNAEQALVEAGRRGTIRVATRIAGDRIEARVSDDGPGIPSENLARIFEPFFTTKKEGKGTGLGLSLCYGIMQEHGGSIRAESRPGQGASFVTVLPVARDEAAEAETGPARPAGALPHLRILVVDDERSVQDLLVDILSLKGHKVDTASDVPEALQKIASNGHDLIISDMKMPNGTGKDVYLATLQKSPRLAHRILFMTGDGANRKTKRFLEETGNVILPKPFKIEDLEKAIAGVVCN